MGTTIYTSLNTEVTNNLRIATSINFWHDEGCTSEGNANIQVGPGTVQTVQWLESSVLPPKMGYSIAGICFEKLNDGATPSPTFSATLTRLVPGYGKVTSVPGTSDYPPSGSFTGPNVTSSNIFVNTYCTYVDGQPWTLMDNSPFSPDSEVGPLSVNGYTNMATNGKTCGVYVEDNGSLVGHYKYYLYIGYFYQYYVCDPQIYSAGTN